MADPEAMGHWISAQDSPPDFWTFELIQGLIPVDPANALGWCGRLADAALAESARQGVIQSWQLSAPDEAAAYLKDHPALTPAAGPESPPPRQQAD